MLGLRLSATQKGREKEEALEKRRNGTRVEEKEGAIARKTK